MIITTREGNVWQIGTETPDQTGTPITIGAEQQEIRGFGGCFNELGAVALSTLDEGEQTKLVEELFGEDGCNFNIGRIPIGASDYSLEWYSCNDHDGDYEMKHFSIDRDKKYNIPYLRKALAVKPDLTIFASPWSPPTWMKTHRVCNFGNIIKTPENLAAYALYLRKFVEEYKKEGIKVEQIHVQNEPCTTQKFPSTIWDGETLRLFIRDYLADQLDGVADIFFGTINNHKYAEYAGCVLNDPECLKHIKGVSYQWSGRYSLQQTRDDFPDLEYMQSENECGDGRNTWDYAMYTFEMMRHFFRNGASSYVYWNMILGENGVSTWGWLQNSMINIRGGQVVYNPEFYVMKHASAFVKRGAKALELTGPFCSNCFGFQNPNGEMVIVVANPYRFDKKLTIAGKTYDIPSRSFNTIII